MCVNKPFFYSLNGQVNSRYYTYDIHLDSTKLICFYFVLFLGSRIMSTILSFDVFHLPK